MHYAVLNINCQFYLIKCRSGYTIMMRQRTISNAKMIMNMTEVLKTQSSATQVCLMLHHLPPFSPVTSGPTRRRVEKLQRTNSVTPDHSSKQLRNSNDLKKTEKNTDTSTCTRQSQTDRNSQPDADPPTPDPLRITSAYVAKYFVVDWLAQTFSQHRSADLTLS